MPASNKYAIILTNLFILLSSPRPSYSLQWGPTWWKVVPAFGFWGTVVWRCGGTGDECGLRRNTCGEEVGEIPGLWLGLMPDENASPEPKWKKYKDKNIHVHMHVCMHRQYAHICTLKYFHMLMVSLLYPINFCPQERSWRILHNSSSLITRLYHHPDTASQIGI